MSFFKFLLRKHLKNCFSLAYLQVRKNAVKLAGKGIALPILAPSLVRTLSQRPKTEPDGNDVENNVETLILLAKEALKHGDTEKAEAILEMGAKICDEYGIYGNLPFIYDILSMVAFALDDLGKCEAILVNAIEKLIKTGLRETDTYIIDFKLRLARIYNLNNELDLAEVGFKTCLAIQEGKILGGDLSNSTGISYINCSFWYGLHKIRKGEFKEAKKLVNNAYDYSLKIKGLNSYQEMVILYTLTDLNMSLGEYNLALENIHSAILLAKGTGSLDLASCYLKLAKIYHQLAICELAEKAATEALKLALLFSEFQTGDEARAVLEELDACKREKH